MHDDRTRGWLIARLSLAIAVITVFGIPLLASADPMSGLSRWEAFGYSYGAIVAEALAITGLVWMIRIWLAAGRDASSDWRYRDQVEASPMGTLPDEQPPGDRPIEDTRARGWLLARMELAIGAILVLLIPILFLTAPPTYGGSVMVAETPELLGGLIPRAFLAGSFVMALTAEALAMAGLVWMVRIWRGPLRDQVPAWRYRR